MPYPVIPDQPLALANESFFYNNIKSNTTTVVKSGSGLLHWVTINTPGTAETITIYDNIAASGTLISTHTAPVQGAIYEYDIAFQNGLTVVTAGTTAGDYTISFR